MRTCLFCNNILAFHRSSLRFLNAIEYQCENCMVKMHDDFYDHISRYIIHLDHNNLLFQDISIGLYNMEHNFETNLTKIAEWQCINKHTNKHTIRYQLIDIITIPLSTNLNYLSHQELTKKIKLYATFS